jgi:hypothetical protein
VDLKSLATMFNLWGVSLVYTSNVFLSCYDRDLVIFINDRDLSRDRSVWIRGWVD